MGLVAKTVGIVPTKYVSVEISPTSRRVGQVANPKECNFPGINHDLGNDVAAITKDDVVKLGPVCLVGMGAPCQDHSKLRLLPARYASDNMAVKRPGFDGEKGKVFKQGVQVIQWMKEVNPNLKFIVENVDFSDMTKDMEWVAKELGVQPIIMDGSFTRRRRLYWTNISLPQDVSECVVKGNPDSCMDDGRTLFKHGKENFVRTICGSWTGDANNPRANTRLPILVDDDHHEEPQHLRACEAELLMGMPKDCTMGDGITQIVRLRCIGNAWDVNVVSLIMCAYRAQQGLKPKEGALSKSDKLLQQSLVMMQSTMGDDAFAEVIAKYGKQDQVRFLWLLTQWHETKIVNKVNSCGSILDSGSGRHINNQVNVSNTDDAVPLKGFNGTVSWTSGSGTLPIVLKDEVSGKHVTMKVDSVDKVESNSEPILSLGKLLRQGVDFHFTDQGKTCEAISPNGKMRFQVELGPDDVLRIKHDVVNSNSSTNGDKLDLEGGVVMNVTHQISKPTATFLHELFNHGSDEIVYQTLLHTIGFKAVRLVKFHCSSCAQANARKRGISHKTLMVYSASGLSEEDYEDSESQSDGDDDVSDSDIVEWETKLMDELSVSNKQFTTREPTQHQARFDVDALKPYEVMMADNKSFPCEVRGGHQTTFLLIDVKTQRKYVVKLERKISNHIAMSEIIAMTGAHKLPYSCTLYTDGCGSMKPVRQLVMKMGIAHIFIPPHMQSLNEAEKVVDRAFAATRTHMLNSGAPLFLFGDCLEFVIYIDAYMATNPKRGYLTPLELEHDEIPSVHHLIPWFTKCVVAAPKQKRLKLKKGGDVLSTGEPGRFIGWQAQNSKVCKILLDGKGSRIVHAIRGSVSYEFGNTKVTAATPKFEEAQMEFELEIGLNSEEALPLKSAKEANKDLIEDKENVLEPHMGVDYNSDGEREGWSQWGELGNVFGEPEPRPRPKYDGEVKSNVNRIQSVMNIITNDEVVDHVKDAKLCALVEQAGDDHGLLMEITHHLAMNVSQTDMNWNKALKSDDRDKVIEAYHAEMESLQNTILTPILEGDPKYANAVDMATSGRFLLDIKRSGVYKARGVKQGFKEDLEETDGPNFNYYSHVAEMKAVRAALLRPNRGTRRIATKDVRTAFLQSIPYPNGKTKLLKFKCPLTSKWLYFEQSGPIYGENAAPVYWTEETLAVFLQDPDTCCLVRGDNHKCVYYNATRDLLIITYVDDIIMDGQEEDVVWFSNLLDARFDCKPLEWLVEGDGGIDFLGMQVFVLNDRVYLSMEKYIDKMEEELTKLGLDISTRKVTTPMVKAIDGESESLTQSQTRLFLTGLGMLAWTTNTTRLDEAYAFSRTGQHAAKPSVSALESLSHQVAYLIQHKNLCLSVELFPEKTSDVSLPQDERAGDQHEWMFYTDSDHAGNTEIQNKRRSQNGMVSLHGGTPIHWMSKASSVTFATPLVGEAHADVSSGGVETYATGNATYEILDISYLAEEAGMKFPFPFLLQMDNTTAEAFCNETVKRSKLKHIDCRQEWVKLIRDKSIMVPIHVDTKLNLADLFTKILDSTTFVSLRDKMMVPCSLPKRGD